MKQIITIDELWCNAIIGIYPHEREKTQPIMLRVVVDVDASQAIESDSITHTLDYDILSRTLREHAESHSYGLVETLLAKLLKEISRFDDALSAELTISKPKALEQLGATVSLSGRWER